MPPFTTLSDLTLPEYRERHLFTARLRLVIVIGFWIPYLYFYHDVLDQTKAITYTISGSFLTTSLAYYCILKNKYLVPAFIAELLADLVTITTIIYITEGIWSDFFTLYVFYAFAGGIFFHYILAFFLAACSLVTYGIFLWLCVIGVIPPLILDFGNHIAISPHTPGYHFLATAIFSGLAVYGVQIASHFSQQRERMLEARNKELTALAQMSSSIRSTLSIDTMLDRVLNSLMQGLDLDLPMLLLFDRDKNEVAFHLPRDHSLVKRAEKLLKASWQPLRMKLKTSENSALEALKNHQLVFRKDLSEVLVGMTPAVSTQTVQMLQTELGISRFVAVPMVAEQEVVGALVGFVKTAYVDEQTVKTLEAFANHAALSIEATLLIDRLKRANEELTEANRVKSEFLATMSHELRTPLTAIIGFSELLLEGVMGPLTEEQQDSLREVLNNGATLLDLINNLLDMAKIEAGKMTLEIAPFDLADLLRRLTQTIASLIQRKGHKLELHLPAKSPLLYADERKLQQVILNLLSNAIKFTPEGGRIEVALDYRASQFELSVIDNGIGIKTENLDKVFEMFQQGDGSVTRSFGGTGLGLALAKQFVELHRGTIMATSEYGKGAKFTVVLPEKTML